MPLKTYKNFKGVENAIPESEIDMEAFVKLQNIHYKDGRLRKLPGLVEINSTKIGTDPVSAIFKSHQVVPNLNHRIAVAGSQVYKFNTSTNVFDSIHSGLKVHDDSFSNTYLEFLEYPPYLYMGSNENRWRRFDGGTTLQPVGSNAGTAATDPRLYSRIIFSPYAGRFFGIGNKLNPDYLEWSDHIDTNGIEQWPTGNIQIVQSTGGDVPLEIDIFEGRISIFSKNSINSGTVSGVPEGWTFEREKSQTGAIARRSIKRWGSSFLMLTPDFEVYLWPQDIFVTYKAVDGGRRRKRVKFNIDPNRAYLACAEIVENRYYYLSFESGSNEPDDDYHLWIYDILADQWSGPHIGYNVVSMFWDKDENLLNCGGAGSAGQAGDLSGYVMEHRGRDIRNRKSKVHFITSYNDYGSPVIDKRFNNLWLTAKQEGSLGGVGQLELITNVDGAYDQSQAQRVTLEDPANDNPMDTSAVKVAVTKRGYIHDAGGRGTRIQLEGKHEVQGGDLEISEFSIEYDLKKYKKENRAA